MIIRVSKLIISQPAVRGNHVVRRDLPGGDWLTVEELSGQLPGWGRNLHASFAVVLVLSGEGVFHGLDERRWELTPGMAFVHLPGVRHRVQRHRPSAWRQLVLRTSIGAWEALSVFADPLLVPVWQAGPGAQPALQALRVLLAGPAVPGWAVLARTAEALSRLAPPTADPWDTAITALSSDHLRNLDLAGLAAELGLSYSHFRRVFRQRTGMAPGTWRRTRRLHEATRLVEDGLPAVAAARATGWTDGTGLAKARRLTRR
jgi:AraC-like DNA-binding protein